MQSHLFETQNLFSIGPYSLQKFSDFFVYDIPNLKSKEEEQKYDPKYKTELCKKFQTTGKCPYGHKCRFAHGKEELISKNCGTNYKKKFCKGFAQKGFCPYGTRCSFIHNEKEFSNTSLSYFYFQTFLFKYTHSPLSFIYSDINENKIKNKRLEVFSELTMNSLNGIYNINLNNIIDSNIKSNSLEHNSSISTISIDENENKKNEIKNEEEDLN